MDIELIQKNGNIIKVGESIDIHLNTKGRGYLYDLLYGNNPKRRELTFFDLTKGDKLKFNGITIEAKGK